MCEDYPCCGHELGDCEGNLYGSDEAIKASIYENLYQDEDGSYDEYGFLGDYF